MEGIEEPRPSKLLFTMYLDEDGMIWSQTGQNISEFELYGFIKSYMLFLESSLKETFIPQD